MYREASMRERSTEELCRNIAGLVVPAVTVVLVATPTPMDSP